MKRSREFGYQGDYLYKGWELAIHRNSNGTYNGQSQGFYCYTTSQRDIKVKRKFRLWVNSLPDEAFINKREFIMSRRYNNYRKTVAVGY